MTHIQTKRFFLYALLAITSTLFAQSKRPMQHSDYSGWKNIPTSAISPSGEWIIYQIAPQRGDGTLYFAKADGSASVSIPRGTSASFTAAQSQLVALIKPEFEAVRKAKLDKKKPDEMPKDTLLVVSLSSGELKKRAPVSSYKKGEEANWIAFQWEKTKEPKDSTQKDTLAKKEVVKKSDGKKLSILDPATNTQYDYQNVVDYAVAKSSDNIAFVVTEKADSVETSTVYIFDAKTEKTNPVFQAKGKVIKLALDEQGQQLAFLHSSDTTKIKKYTLYLQEKGKKPVDISSTYASLLNDKTVLSENAQPYFSKSGARLFFGIGQPQKEEPKDTLLPEEKAVLDLWSWQDELFQPAQLLSLSNDKKRSFSCVYHIKTKKAVQLADDAIRSVYVAENGDAPTALAYDDKPYRWENSFGEMQNDVYLIDILTGKRTLLFKASKNSVALSPDGKYAAYFDSSDTSYYAKDIAKGTQVNLTKDIKGINFYNESVDTPSPVRAYGILGWAKGDKALLVYDKYDVWELDPTGKNTPKNITKIGREKGLTFRYERTDREERFISPSQKMLLTAFDNKTKENGYYAMNYGSDIHPEIITMEKMTYSALAKAKNADKYIFRKGNFEQFPELYSSDINFKNAKSLTNANPQQDSILWGSVELVSWRALDGQQLEGLLYKPENFDPTKKYPMIVYFYETYSSQLYLYYMPSPSRSIINFPYFTSNDYLVFIPDIKYTTGYPGRSAENAIISGTLAMIDKGFVDPKAIGLQGQSWGGYQTAYLITQTNLFAAAGAGAPVSNMTSAYGGVRWESGRSRTPQYESGQSRIGGTLWENPMQYIENSPIFYAPKVNTPLFMTHNDQDGAVPWYQGIEYYVALRRLGKPVWMVNYNGDAHNLRAESWGNRIDLSIRLEQFFGHYLKGEPMPKWMKDGIPALEKGQMGYER